MALYSFKYSPAAAAEGSNVKSTTVSADSVTWNNGYIVFTLNGVLTKAIRMDLIDEVDLGT